MVSNFMGAFAGGAAGAASVQIVISAVDDFSKTLAKANSSFKDFGKAVEKGIGIAVVALAGFTALAVKEYAEVQLLNKRLAFSFGDLADDVEVASRQIKNVTTLSMEEVKTAFLETKPMFEAFGLSFEEQTALIKRAADVASASGKEFNEVLGVFESVLSGKAGPAAKALGIIIEEDTKGMSALQKATLGYNAIASDTARTIGAGENDRDSIVGRMKLLGIAVNDLTQSFGEGFTQAFTDADNQMDSFIKKLDEFNPQMKILGEGVADVAKAIGIGLLTALKGMINMMDRIIGGFFFWKQFFQLVKDGVSPTKAWGTAMELTESRLKNMNDTLSQSATVIKTQNVPAMNEMTQSVRTYGDAIEALNAGVPFTPTGKTGGKGSGGGGGGGGSGGGGEEPKFGYSGLYTSPISGKQVNLAGNNASDIDYYMNTLDKNAYINKNLFTNKSTSSTKSQKVGAQRTLGTGSNRKKKGGGKYHDANLLISKTGEIAEFDSQDTITARKGGGGTGMVVNVYVAGNVWSVRDLTKAIEKEISQNLFNKVSVTG